MSILIYNTLTRKKEELVPIKPGQIGMYVCGPTVYDVPHIGHARSAYVFDVIRRYLEYKGLKVKFVRNVTDVDDKIIEKARVTQKPRSPEAQKPRNPDAQKCGCPDTRLKDLVKEVSEKYLKAYHEDMSSLGIKAPDKEPRATEYIPKMIKFIEALVKNGSAYLVGGDVYFDIKKAKDYGKLSHQNLEKMEIGARIAPGEKKKDPLDFALWKAAKEDEPSWDSPWGKGRPGWHIECSVMSSDILGDEFDIHCGGIDLVFPHHENEIAQSEGAGKKFARYWLHNGLLTINGEKMAKSLGNFVTIKDILKKYSADDLKMFFLSAHYSNPIDYTEARMREARESLDRVFRFVKKIDKEKLKYKKDERIENIKYRFIKAMNDDFSAPKGLACIFELVNLANKNINDRQFAFSAFVVIKELLNIFGIDLKQSSPKILNILVDIIKDERGETNLNIESLISKREQLRKEKKFKEADEIRKMLDEKDIILEDTKEGPAWRRKPA